ncbi:hypothetical protein [Cloacibacterium caeni]|uniref:hypothetical protein n=1 Tax=Cloacibacterium caeni TaxID=2004710 RepID=UPI001BCB2B8B|nr:hypothetical protein [Cloacibacterium caeni]
MQYLNIATHYGLGKDQRELDFVDVNLKNDNLLFIDPRLIEISNAPLSKKMQKNIEMFWAELIKLVRAKDTKGITRILSGMKEPNETKLGYSSNRIKGNSISKKLKPKLIDAIKNNKAVQSGILSHFADIELFIEDISSDRISDITTKIIKSNLIEFTQEQCKIHNIPMSNFHQKDIFNRENLSWENKDVLLPYYLGVPIIFVPKEIVRLEFMANSNINCFYRFAIRNFLIYDKDLIVDITPTGKDGELQLKDIKSKYPCSKESLSNWILKYGKLLVDYKSEILNGKIRPLSDFEIMQIVYQNYNEDVA